jgi:hypothetical protein
LNEAAPGDRDVRVKKRVALILILIACVVLGTLGFLYALWLRARPAGQ